MKNLKKFQMPILFLVIAAFAFWATLNLFPSKNSQKKQLVTIKTLLQVPQDITVSNKTGCAKISRKYQTIIIADQNSKKTCFSYWTVIGKHTNKEYFIDLEVEKNKNKSHSMMALTVNTQGTKNRYRFVFNTRNGRGFKKKLPNNVKFNIIDKKSHWHISGWVTSTTKINSMIVFLYPSVGGAKSTGQLQVRNFAVTKPY